MPTKEDLSKNQRALYRISDAAKIAGTSPEKIVSKVHQIEADLLYEAPSGLLLYCLAVLKQNTYIPIEIRANNLHTNIHYIKADSFDYVVLSRAQHYHILHRGETTTEEFGSAITVDNSQTGKINHFTAHHFFLENLRKDKWLSPTYSGIPVNIFKWDFKFCFYRYESAIHPHKTRDKTNTRTPSEKTSLLIRIEDLWITKSSLIQISDDSPIEEEEEDSSLIPCWANKKLAILNLACKKFYADVSNGSSQSTQEEKKKAIEIFIKEQYKKSIKKELSVTAIKHCLHVVTKNDLRNTTRPSPDVINSYHPTLSTGVINMNEVARTTHQELTEKQKKDSSAKPPTIDEIKDKNKEHQAIPKGMAEYLSSFMIPKP